jgi:hypothetical protein
METKQYFIKAISGFCVEHSHIARENELFWLSESELLARLSINAERQKILATRRTRDGLAA